MDTKENLTRCYIYKAFAKLLETNHYDKISVCDITEKAGVSRMSFYRNFKSKEDLTLKGIEHIVKKVVANIKKHEKISIYVITKEFFEVAKDYKNIVDSFENSPISKELISTTIARLRDNMPTDYMNNTSKYIPIFYFGAISSTMFDWLRKGAKETPEEMAKMIASLINSDFDDV